jgi:hypothetical protein
MKKCSPKVSRNTTNGQQTNSEICEMKRKEFVIGGLHTIRITKDFWMVRANSLISEDLMWAKKPFPKKKYTKGTVLVDVRPFGSNNPYGDYPGCYSVQFTDTSGVNYTTYRLPEDCFEFIEKPR